MGMSRATVIAYLNEARERGIVNISIEPARLASLSLAQSLKSHFNLRDCLVVPNNGDDRALARQLGAAGALALRKYLKSGDTLAVTGGRTVMSVGVQSEDSGAAGRNGRSGDWRRGRQEPIRVFALRLDHRVSLERHVRKPLRPGSDVDRRSARDHGRRAACRRTAPDPLASQQGAVWDQRLAAEHIP